MKKILLILALCGLTGTASAQFPTQDSLIKFVNKWIRNSAVDAFTNLRLNTALIGMINYADSQGIKSVSYTGSTLRIITKGKDTFNVTISGGGGGGNANSNIGSGFRLAVPNTNNIKTIFAGLNLILDSSTNTNALTFKMDTAGVASYFLRIKDSTTKYVTLTRLKDSMAVARTLSVTNLDTSRNSTTATVSSSTGSAAVLKVVSFPASKAGLMSPQDKGRLDSLYNGLLEDSSEVASAGDSGVKMFYVRNDTLYIRRLNGATLNADSSASVTGGGGGSGGISSLNGLTGGTQTFANGTSGTAPAFVSSGTTHTLNIPNAATSSVTGGLLSKTQFDAFTAKTSSFAPVTTGKITKWAADSPPQMTDTRLTDMGTGDITMTNGTVFDFNGVRVGPSVFSIAASNAALTSNGATGLLWLADGNGATNGKIWDFAPSGTNLSLRLVNDAYGAATDALRFNRTGTTFNYAYLNGKLRLATPSTGGGSDSVLVWAAADSSVKKIAQSSLGGGGSAGAEIHDSLVANSVTFDNANLGDTIMRAVSSSVVQFKGLVAGTGIQQVATDSTIRTDVTLTTNQIAVGASSLLGSSSALTYDGTTLKQENAAAVMGAVSTTALSTSSGARLFVATSSLPTANTNQLGGIDFVSRNGATDYLVGAQIAAQALGAWTATSNQPTALIFRTQNTSSLTEKMRITGSGNTGIGVSSPLAVLHLKAGTASAATAPLKFTSGTVLTTPEAGIMEYDGTNFYLSPSTTRKRIPLTDNTTPSNGFIPIGNGTDYTTAAITGGSTLTVTNGAGSITLAVPTTFITSGTFTPTLTNTTNITASTAYAGQYMRVGNTVTMSGEVDIDPLAGATITVLTMTIPIASTLGASNNLSGAAANDDVIGNTARVKSNGAGAAVISFIPNLLTSGRYSYTYTYIIN